MIENPPDSSSRGNSDPESGHSPLSGQQKMREAILATACGGMSIALSTVLSLFTLIHMPQGGSLTPASMLPIIFCALAFGPSWGMSIGAVYGVLQYIINPLASNWASFILDYPVAFGMLGLAGFFAAARMTRVNEKNILRRIGLISLPRILMAVFLAMAGRTVCHVLSGVVFYAEYAGDQNPWIYSLLYNGTYMLPEMAITCILLLPLASVFRSRRT